MHFKDSLLALLPVSLLLPLYRWRNRMAHLTDGELLLQIGQMFLRGKNIAGAGSCFQLLLQGEGLIEAFLLGLLLKNSPEGRFVLKRSPVEDSSLVELQLLRLLSLKKGSPKRRGELSQLAGDLDLSRINSRIRSDFLLELFLALESERLFVLARQVGQALMELESEREDVAYHLARFLRNRGELRQAVSLLEVPDLSKRQMHLKQLLESELAVLRDGTRSRCTSTSTIADARGALHVLEASLPFRKSGYTFRSEGILSAQAKSELKVFAVTRPGFGIGVEEGEDHFHFPYDRLVSEHGDRYRDLPLQDYLEHYSSELFNYALVHRPSVIHAHSDYKNGLAALNVGEALDLPVVYELRGLFEDTQVALGEIDASSDRYLFTRKLEEECCLRSDAVVVLGDALREDLIKRGVDGKKIFVVPNGVDVSPRRDLKAKEKHSPVVLGYVGTLNSYEGIDFLIRTVHFMKREKHFPLHLRIVGDGPDRENLEALVTQLRFSDGVTFQGVVPQSELSNEYERIDVFCLPRTSCRVCQLVTPLKPFEALSYGAPVLASDLPALRRLFKERIWYSKPGDREDFISVLETQILKDWKAAQERVQKAQEWISQSCTWEKAAERYLTVYDFAEQRHSQSSHASAARRQAS